MITRHLIVSETQFSQVKMVSYSNELTYEKICEWFKSHASKSNSTIYNEFVSDFGNFDTEQLALSNFVRNLKAIYGAYKKKMKNVKSPVEPGSDLDQWNNRIFRLPVLSIEENVSNLTPRKAKLKLEIDKKDLEIKGLKRKLSQTESISSNFESLKNEYSSRMQQFYNNEYDMMTLLSRKNNSIMELESQLKTFEDQLKVKYKECSDLEVRLSKKEGAKLKLRALQKEVHKSRKSYERSRSKMQGKISTLVDERKAEKLQSTS